MAIIGALPNTISNGQAIDAIPVMADFNWIVNQVNSNGAALGSTNTFTASQTGVSGNSASSFPIISQIQNNSTRWCGAAGGTANALTLTTTPAIAAYSGGQEFIFQASATNTAATTVAVSGLSTIAIQVSGNVCLGGEVISGRWYKVLVDASATSCQLQEFSILSNYKTTNSSYVTSSNLGLTAVHLGSNIALQGSTPAQTLTLPTVTGVVGGRAIYVVNQSTVAWTLATAGAETITYTTVGVGSSTATTLTLSPGDSGLYVWRSASTSWFEHQGVRAANISSANPGIIAYRNWTATGVGVNNFNVVCAADEVLLETSTNAYITRRAVALTINANGSVGAPLSIMQARAANTFYYIWLWYNTTNGITGTLDVSSSAPTAPTGYVAADYKSRMPGWILTDGSGNKYPLQTKIVGRRTVYVPLSGSNVATYIQLSSGTVGSVSAPTWVAVGLTGYLPPTITSSPFGGRAFGTLSDGATQNVAAMVAPNNQYGALTSTSNPPPVSNTIPTGQNGFSTPYEFVLESNSIYWASTGTFYLYLMGGEENI